MASPTAPASLVYMDLEATGLRSSGRPRITELCLVAVRAEDLLSPAQARVVGKLCLPVYPMAIIPPHVTDMTGLDNTNLSGQAPFSAETGELVRGFLARLPRPVCLVAHNGDYYDFPLLRAELVRAGVELPVGLRCADSWVGLQQLLGRQGEEEGEERKDKRVSGAVDREESESKIVQTNHYDQGAAQTNATEIAKEDSSDWGDMTDSELLSFLPAEENETTPTRLVQSVALAAPTNHKRGRSPDSSKENDEPDTVSKENMEAIPARKLRQPSCAKIFTARRRLQFGGSVRGKSDRGRSFKLTDLHTELVGHAPRTAHGAEADCLTLLRVTAVVGQSWLDWVSSNSTCWESCRPMWGPGRDTGFNTAHKRNSNGN